MCRRRLGAKRAAKVRRGEDRLTTNNNVHITRCPRNYVCFVSPSPVFYIPFSFTELKFRKEAKIKFEMRLSVPLALSALATISQAEESLYSKRMTKRGIDSQGNYNICKLSTSASQDIAHIK
jgi:hypothetical protein